MNPPDDSLLCPITLEIFQDPVVAEDGHTYERQAIVNWINNRGASPITQQPLSVKRLYPNFAIKKAVNNFETTVKNKNYQFTLGVDVKRRSGRPLFQTFGKTIYHAEWLQDKEKRPEVILLKIDGARAKKEASFYVKLTHHPHIVRTYGLVFDQRDDDDSNEAFMLLQEYAPLGSLLELVQDNPMNLTENVLIEIFLQICDAMSFLAYNNVVHGDLACRNILVFRFDEKDVKNVIVKVTDFGLSRHSKIYSLTSSATSTVLNIIPTRYAAPEILSPSVRPEYYTEKSDVYSMGVLMWEAYSRGKIPWAKIESDLEVTKCVTRGEKLPKPSNCSENFWAIICKTWSLSPKDRPNFVQLKRLLIEAHLSSSSFSNESGPITFALSSSNDEFKSVKEKFIQGWPYPAQSEIIIKAIHKINNPLLKSRYEQLCRSDPERFNIEHIGWHGTVAKCHDGKCGSLECSLCQIIRHGFKKECTRKDTYSHQCWGEAIYFGQQSFVCHNYNGGSQLNSKSSDRCVIMTDINYGRHFDSEEYFECYQRFIHGNHSYAEIPRLLEEFDYDSLLISRDYYVAPANYVLLRNNLAALPRYVVVYALRNNQQVRKTPGKYCSFHKVYHTCSTGCDGHYHFSCLGRHGSDISENYDGIAKDRGLFQSLNDSELSALGRNFVRKKGTLKRY